MSEVSTNPCRFKAACVSCKVAGQSDRPTLCISLECNHYTPCTRCLSNRVLNDKGLCNVCIKNASKKQEKTKAGLSNEGKFVEATTEFYDSLTSGDESEASTAATLRELTITIPGSPPPQYSDAEKDYYLHHWKEYTGYYRDPTAKTLVHNIIIFEVELNYLSSFMIANRGNPKKEVEAQRNRLIKNLKDLRDQLPSKEANEESDDEKAMAMIYEAWVKERGERAVGPTRRIFSQEALALAPHLIFRINPQAILERLGYKLVDAIQACDSVVIDDLPSDPEKMLEYFGFFLREKYALPIGLKLNHEEEPALPTEGAQLAAQSIQRNQAFQDDDDDTPGDDG